MRDDRGVAGVARHGHRVERFGDGADLVQLDEQGVADAVGDAPLQDLRIGHEHIVADQLDAVAERRVSACQPCQSPSARPSSMETIGYCRSQSS